MGGRQNADIKIMPEFPVEMDNYVEPFWAAEVSCFSLTYVKEGIIKVRGIYAYDPNEPLIHVYKNIQTSHVSCMTPFKPSSQS
jgi:site-specific DNA-adenine methylase